ncbi:MAG: NADH-quinone oxidoreductase subunit N [Cyclobacteriaceae bacterium]|nr:NADH-quinone oxidoreductase subunit N [Cyclobacteriaceae bacterium]MDH5249560.1 NADH-quinone oxidoreductase subunit N [Cyclobacteriaceae bacterium]
MADLKDKLELIGMSLSFFVPELVLIVGIILLIGIGLRKKQYPPLLTFLSLLLFSFSFLCYVFTWRIYVTPQKIFNGFLRSDDFSAFLKMLFDVAGILTVLMTWRKQKEQRYLPEYYALLFAIVLGAHLLVMSMNLIMVFISLELISISAYVLTGFSFSKKGAEGSMKYFLFGSVASAVMLYGFSMLYGLTGTLDFSSAEFIDHLLGKNSTLFFIAALMALAGFLYKIAAAPLHLWAPDVYEAAPMPIVAFFSVVPKLAGIGVLTKFILAINIFGQSAFDWQFIISLVSILSLTVGNFSALLQKNPKRLMAYSSIAQSGFLLAGVAAFLPQGVHFMLFYATVYMFVNFLVFVYLQYFESYGFSSLESFSGAGRTHVWPSILILIGFVSLTGLPPTAGFTAKFFVFSSLWEAYHLSGKNILLWLLIFGLLNTVVSLFYYLRIPYYTFIKEAESGTKTNFLAFENLLGFVLVLLVFVLFFYPGLLMGWINKINFVL